MTDKEWLRDLQVGQHVAVRMARGLFVIKSVERLTPTQIVIAGSSVRYRRKDGRGVGEFDSWTGRPWITQPTDKICAEIELRGLQHRVSHINVSKLTTDQLRRIAAILDEGKEKE